MSIYIIISIVVSLALLVVAAAKIYQIRKGSVSDFRHRHVNTYIIKRLTQRTFTKAVNIVMDLVNSDGADIEVIYKDEVIFNGYIDRDDYGNDAPHFWYNKKVLDAHNIKY